MKKLFILALLALSATFAHAGVNSEIVIDRDGKVIAKNVTLYQKSTTILYSRVTWGDVFVRMTVLTNSDTKIIKKHGEVGTIADLKDGDILDVEGTIPSGSESLMINAKVIRNISLEKESKTISGIVKNINSDARTFEISDVKLGVVKVSVPGSVSIKKGVRTISFGDLISGDKVISSSGIYDYATGGFSAQSLEIFQDKAIFTARNYQGILKSISSKTLPSTLVITVGNEDFIVYTNTKTEVLNNKRAKVSLSRYVEGDTVRFYGARRQANLSEFDAEVVRDISF